MGFQDLLKEVEENNKVLEKNTDIVEEKESENYISVDLSKFNKEDLKALESMKNEIKIGDVNSIASFGAEIQGSIAKFADGILEGVRTKDTGHVGNNLSLLLTTIQSVDVEKLQEKKSITSKIPFLNKIKKSFENSKIQLENVTQTVDKIVVALDTARKELIRDVNVLDALYNKNLEYVHKLEMYIAAGELKYKELKETILIELKNRADKTKDMLDIQKYNDFAQMLNEMEKRIHDLKLSREIAIQTLPQIRLMQNNDKILANKIQSSILTTIPVWKNQIALAISLNKQKTALELQKKVSDTTENMLKQNAELLKMNTLEIAKESERGIISMDTLRETHMKLIETIEGSMKIYEEGRQKRETIEKELVQLENTQKQKLLALRSQYK
ncbi:toxic anion resistance protein [Crassaminicella thermophila]|uniref:Toxic anion resistance protein n=1 Tax=Crassaminicella thermophila TaxID=2599308 RepID=A0A5C0SHZ2_CRATE|nr:toxic anion resistance protein [Crassaminicella thermophila]QEK13297.1 toxic anion resistance protein [Crassaminicella thermophila]